MGEVSDDLLGVIATKLYAAPPEQFTEARDEAVATAKAAGDTKLASAIGKLRKPTVGAWVVNLLAHKRPDLIDQLVEIATALRQAQQNLRGAQLKQLTSQRRSVVSALVNEAQALAQEARPGAKLPLTEVEATLNAALSDEEVAAQVRSGRLAKTTTYEGFGGIEVIPQAPAADDAELRAARKAEAAARAEVDKAAAGEQEAQERLSDLEAELEELKQRHLELKEELNQARHTHKFAQRALAAATRRVSEAEAM